MWQQMSSEKQELVHGGLGGHSVEFEFDTEFDGSYWACRWESEII